MSARGHSFRAGRAAALAALLAIAAPALPASAVRDDPARLCLEAARIASERSGVPYRVLLALSLTETGRSETGRSETGRNETGGLMPWPWAVNRAGQSLWPGDRASADAYVRAAIASGETNLDLGCFQVNWGWHGANFPSVDAMLDPVANAAYAAALLARHHGRSGDWRAAAAAYHSATPELAARYLARFEPIYDALGEGDGPPGRTAGRPVARAGAASANAFPLLLPGPTAGLGSLVPVAATARPLIGGN